MPELRTAVGLRCSRWRGPAAASGTFITRTTGTLLTQRSTHSHLNGRTVQITSSPGPTTPLLKTPTSNIVNNGGSQHPEKRKSGGHGPNLADEVEWPLPTPKASDGTKGSPNQRHGGGT